MATSWGDTTFRLTHIPILASPLQGEPNPMLTKSLPSSRAHALHHQVRLLHIKSACSPLIPEQGRIPEMRPHANSEASAGKLPLTKSAPHSRWYQARCSGSQDAQLEQADATQSASYRNTILVTPPPANNPETGNNEDSFLQLSPHATTGATTITTTLSTLDYNPVRTPTPTRKRTWKTKSVWKPPTCSSGDSHGTEGSKSAAIAAAEERGVAVEGSNGPAETTSSPTSMDVKQRVLRFGYGAFFSAEENMDCGQLRGGRGLQSCGLSIPTLVKRLLKGGTRVAVESALDGWTGRLDGRNLPLLVKEVVQVGEPQLVQWVFEWSRMQRTYMPRPSVFNAMMRLYAKRGKPQLVEALFRDMEASSCKPTVHTFVALVSAHSRAGSFDRALYWLDAMDSYEVAPTCAVFNYAISACGACGQASAAVELLERSRQRRLEVTVVSHNVVLSALKSEGRHAQALAVFRDWLARGVRSRPDTVSFNIVLDCLCKLGRWDDVLAMYARMRDAGVGVRPDTVTYNTVMHACATSGRWRDARALLDVMQSAPEGDNARPDTVTFNTLMRAYAVQGMHEAAEGMFRALCDSGRQPDLVSYSTLMNAYSKAGCGDGARGVMERMRAAGLRPNVVTYNNLVEAYAREGRYEDAAACINEMEGQRLPPNVVTFGCLAMACARSQRPEEAERVLKRVRDAGIAPSSDLYNTVLATYLGAGLHERARDILADMQDADMEGNEVTFTLLIDRAGKDGQPEKAQALFDSMLALGVRAGVEVYTALIDAYGKQGMISDVERVLKTMKAAGLRPNVCTYTTLIQAYGRAEECDKAVEAFEQMRAEGVQADSLVYASMLDVYNKNSRYESALALWHEIVAQKRPLTTALFNEALIACCRLKKWPIALATFNQMSGKGCPPNIRTFHLLITALCGSGQHDQSIKVLSEMRGMGIEPTLTTYQLLISGLSRAFKWVQAMEVLDMMEEVGLHPTEVAYNTILSTLARLRLMTEALLLVDRMCTQGCEPDPMTYRILAKMLEKGGEPERAQEVRAWLKDLRHNKENSQLRFASSPLAPFLRSSSSPATAVDADTLMAARRRGEKERRKLEDRDEGDGTSGERDEGKNRGKGGEGPPYRNGRRVGEEEEELAMGVKVDARGPGVFASSLREVVGGDAAVSVSLVDGIALPEQKRDKLGVVRGGSKDYYTKRSLRDRDACEREMAMFAIRDSSLRRERVVERDEALSGVGLECIEGGDEGSRGDGKCSSPRDKGTPKVVAEREGVDFTLEAVLNSTMDVR